MINKKICVIGLGYIGLPTASFLANKGYQVYGMDIDTRVVNIINDGRIHIVEPDLDIAVQSAINSSRLKAYTSVQQADIFMIAVPTPFHNGYTPNIDYIIDACINIAKVAKEGDLIILESTSPVGTTRKIQDKIYKLRSDLVDKIYFAYAPERVLPGQIIKELSENDRIVGGVDGNSTSLAYDFYKTFVSGQVLQTNCETAEMSKLTENSFRDVNIAFANELSIICDGLNIDTNELISLANHHPRVNILNPGVGVGGHCIAVDPYFIIDSDKENSKIISIAREVNNYKTQWVIEKIKNESMKFEIKNNKKPSIACLGLAFKQNVDDLRESPALSVVKTLINNGLDILAVEPNISNLEGIKLYKYEDVVESADILIKLVAHDEFKKLQKSERILFFT